MPRNQVENNTCAIIIALVECPERILRHPGKGDPWWLSSGIIYVSVRDGVSHKTLQPGQVLYGQSSVHVRMHKTLDMMRGVAADGIVDDRIVVAGVGSMPGVNFVATDRLRVVASAPVVGMVEEMIFQANPVELLHEIRIAAVIDSGVARADLLALARAGDDLLDLSCDTHPDDRRELYLQRLGRLGMLNRLGEAKLPAVAGVMDARWSAVLGHWPGLARDGRCVQGWLGALLMGRHGSPPLHHLLLEGALNWAERCR